MGEHAGARMIVGVCARERVAGQCRFARETVEERVAGGRQRRARVHGERSVEQGTSQVFGRDQQQHRHLFQLYIETLFVCLLFSRVFFVVTLSYGVITPLNNVIKLCCNI